VLWKLRRDSTVVRKDSAETQESKNPSEGSERRRKLRKGSVVYAQRDSSSRSSQREQAKVEAFGNSNSSKSGKKREGAQEEQQQPLDRPNRSGPSSSSRPGGAPEEAHRRGGPTAVGSHEEIPSAVRSGGIAWRLSLRRRAERRTDLSRQI
jgi:hypothetical protein